MQPTAGVPPGSSWMPTTESSSAPSRSASNPTGIRASRRGRSRAPVPSSIDGLATSSSTADIPDATAHRTTSSRSTTSSCSPPISIARSTRLAEQGLELRRVREGPAGDGREVKQAFFRMAEVILEVVATGRGGDEPAQFLGAHVPVGRPRRHTRRSGPRSRQRGSCRGANRTPHRDGARLVPEGQWLLSSINPVRSR